MPSWIVIDGVDAYDGRYDLDLSYFTNREYHTIRQQSGLRVSEIEEAMEATDAALVVALAGIALDRAGKHVHWDLLWDAKAGLIKLVFEADRPLDETTPEPGSGGSEN